MRQQKVNSQGTTNYVWDEQNVLLETNASLITLAHYTDFPGYWGGLVSELRSATSSFYGFDSQSSTRILVSISGLVTDNYSYKAFGEELASGSGTVNPYRYVGAYGYYRDIATRQYVRARILEVTNGRWISRDPIGFDGGDWNLYRYVSNSPVDSFDPSGKLARCPKGWDAINASVTKCNQPGKGMTKMYCQYSSSSCPATCCCTTLSGLTGGLFAAIKGKKLVCGAKVQVKDRRTGGKTKTVTIIDQGPYANDADIDLNIAVFGRPKTGATIPVCVSPISGSKSPIGWGVCLPTSLCGDL